MLSVEEILGVGPAPGSPVANQVAIGNGSTFRYTGSGVASNSNRGFELVSGNGTIDVSTGTATLTLSGIVGGAGTLTKVGSGNLSLSNQNTMSGVVVNQGTLTLANSANTLANTAPVTVSGGTVAIGANSDTVGVVTLNSGTISGTTGVLTGSAYNVESGLVSARLGGTGSLTKTTAGTVTLSNTNTYTGSTTVSAGTLEITGSVSSPTFLVDTAATITTSSALNASSGVSTIDGTLSGTGSFNLKSGATLAGSGVISLDTIFEGGSIHSPGNSRGFKLLIMQMRPTIPTQHLFGIGL